MDPFTIKPIDAEGIIANAKECGGRILVVEDHYPEVSWHIFKLADRMRSMRTNGASKNPDWSPSSFFCI